MHAISIKNLSISFGGVKALNSVNLNVKQAHIHGVIGPNGAGKSTLFNVICGVNQPDSGSILYNGTELLRLKVHQRAEIGISRTFQMVQLFHDMTVLENVMTGLHHKMGSGILSATLSLKKMKREENEVREKAIGILKFLEMEAFAGRFGSDLSFGQQRLVEIARALVSEPKLLLLDEPAAGLSIARVPALTKILNKIRDEKSIRSSWWNM